MRDSVLFYRSFWDAVKDLDSQQFKAAVTSIMEYGLNDIAPETSGIEKTIYTLVKPQIDANNRKYLNGTKGGRPKTNDKPNKNQKITNEEPQNNQNITKTKPSDNQTKSKPEPKDKEKVKVKEKVKDNNKTFVPPSAADVEEYCQMGRYHVDAETFVDFYESKGWMIGKTKMKDWKAAVRNWNRSQRQELTAKSTKNRFNNFEQHSYDYDDLERQLVAKNRKG